MSQLVFWLDKQLADRGWSQSEAARRGNFSPSMMQQVLSGVTNPGLDFCRGVSRAFGIPLEDVFRLAGILPSKIEAVRAVRDSRRIVYEVDGEAGVLALWRALSPADQALVRELMERLAPMRIVGEEG